MISDQVEELYVQTHYYGFRCIMLFLTCVSTTVMLSVILMVKYSDRIFYYCFLCRRPACITNASECDIRHFYFWGAGVRHKLVADQMFWSKWILQKQATCWTVSLDQHKEDGGQTGHNGGTWSHFHSVSALQQMNYWPNKIWNKWTGSCSHTSTKMAAIVYWGNFFWCMTKQISWNSIDFYMERWRVLALVIHHRRAYCVLFDMTSRVLDARVVYYSS